MSLDFRIDTFDAKALLDSKLSVKAQERVFGRWCQARTELVDAQNAASAGVAVPKTLTIDGDTVERFKSVPLDATARVDWRSDFEVVSWIWDAIHRFSPVKSGRYRNAHILLADGMPIAGPDPSVQASEYTILSPVVYARKIEGKTVAGGRAPQSPSAPNGVYSVVEALAKREFKNVKISFALVTLYAAPASLGTKSVTAWAMSKHGRAAKLAGTRASRIAYRNLMSGVRNPAIIITFK